VKSANPSQIKEIPIGTAAKRANWCGSRDMTIAKGHDEASRTAA
jgi:hypothetical protein